MSNLASLKAELPTALFDGRGYLLGACAVQGHPAALRVSISGNDLVFAGVSPRMRRSASSSLAASSPLPTSPHKAQAAEQSGDGAAASKPMAAVNAHRLFFGTIGFGGGCANYGAPSAMASSTAAGGSGSGSGIRVGTPAKGGVNSLRERDADAARSRSRRLLGLNV